MRRTYQTQGRAPTSARVVWSGVPDVMKRCDAYHHSLAAPFEAPLELAKVNAAVTPKVVGTNRMEFEATWRRSAP